MTVMFWFFPQAAETGSGKTGAFCLPTLQIVWETIRDAQMGKGNAVANQQSSAGSKKVDFEILNVRCSFVGFTS